MCGRRKSLRIDVWRSPAVVWSAQADGHRAGGEQAGGGFEGAQTHHFGGFVKLSERGVLTMRCGVKLATMWESMQ
jgi:hypothetical protein